MPPKDVSLSFNLIRRRLVFRGAWPVFFWILINLVCRLNARQLNISANIWAGLQYLPKRWGPAAENFFGDHSGKFQKRRKFRKCRK